MNVSARLEPLNSIRLKMLRALKKAHINNRRQEAEIIICEVCNCERLDFYKGDYQPDAGQIENIYVLLEKRCRRLPLAYVINRAFFYGEAFYVDENVLIPRQETEILVHSVIKLFDSNALHNKTLVDIGTGCGNIAISLTKHLSSCRIIATDICPKALRVAERNIESFGLEANIALLKGDLFGPLRGYEDRIDAIVSNPPYVSETEMKNLSDEVKKEPRTSLCGGESGLEYYSRIFNEARFYLKEEGYIFLEIGYGQREAVSLMGRRSGCFNLIQVDKDFRGIDRVMCFKKT